MCKHECALVLGRVVRRGHRPSPIVMVSTSVRYTTSAPPAGEVLPVNNSSVAACLTGTVPKDAFPDVNWRTM